MLFTLVFVVAVQFLQVDLKPVPQPDFSRMHPSIRDGIKQALSQIDAVQSANDRSDEALAAGYGNLGLLYHAMELEDLALAAYENARVLDQEDMRWSYYASFLYQKRGDDPLAKQCLEAVLQLQPRNVHALIRLGKLLTDTNEYAQATKMLEEASHLDPQSAAVWFARGNLELKRENAEVAIAHFQRALELQPQATSIHYQLALAYRQAGETDKARQHLNLRGDGKIVLPDPHLKDLNDMVTTTSVFVALAMAARQEEFSIDSFDAFLVAKLTDRDGVADFLEQVARDKNSAGSPNWEVARLLYATGVVSEKRGDPNRALTSYLRASQTDPAFAQTSLRATELLLQAGHYDRALGLLSELLQHQPEHLEALFLRSAVNLKLNRADGIQAAIRDLTFAHQQEPSRFEFAERLAFAYASDQQWSSAAAMYEKAIALRPEDWSLRTRVASIYGSLGRFEMALEHMQRVVEARPDDEQARLGLLISQILNRNWQNALDGLIAMHQRWPNNTAATLMLARMFAACPQQDLRDGPRALELVGSVRKEVTGLSLVITRAMALAEVGDFDQAMKLQSQVVQNAETEKNPQHPRLLANLIRYQNKQSCCGSEDGGDLIPK